ncbi:MAG: hypothetical protein WCD42_04340 [Rhizomicrobium sp.]
MVGLSVGMAALVSLVGMACFYLPSKHQELLPVPVAGRAFGAIGIVALGISYGLLCSAVSMLTAAYMLVVWLMVLGSFGPMTIAYLRRRGGA